MILYIENPKDATRTLELINEFGKVAQYKINAQKSTALLYIYNERSEREIKETILFTIITKIIKHLGINLPKEAKDLYSENYNTLIKDRKMTQTGGEIHHIPGWVNMTILPKAIYRFSVISIKLSMTFLTE